MSTLITNRSTAPTTWTIDPTSRVREVSPTLYGIFFEEINCAGDGGIYSELVRNRSFEDSDKPAPWQLAPDSSGSITVEKHGDAVGGNLRFLRLRSEKSAGVVNSGYWGIPAVQGKPLRLSVMARSTGGAIKIIASLVGAKGNKLAEAELGAAGSSWGELRATLTPSATDTKAELVLRAASAGTVDLDMVSLKPDGGNGPVPFRNDLLTALKELHPSFVRFPGGCWVEGDTMAFAQRWKTTIGPSIQRRTQPNLWGYSSTNGLGYHEYLLMCEQIGAEPLFVINCGMSHKEVVPMAKMDEFVQDALDAIEYANGPVTSTWGAKRAEAGHPKPFGLRFMEIGNENGGPAYEERYPLFHQAIMAKYPEVRLIANVWGGVPKHSPLDIIDEHYYSNAEFFIENADRYDKYDRNGPRIYVGEYAVTQGNGNGSLKGALGEAAFMTGMERNSDVVIMSSYAPLFANLNAKAWNPDLIYFDNHRVVKTPSYYVQQMFARSRPDWIIENRLSAVPTVRREFPKGAVGIGTWSTQAEFKDIRVERDGKVLAESADGAGMQRESGQWSTAGGAAVQTSNENGARLTLGDKGWERYTVTLKARKRSGAEGFLITVGERDKDNYLWLNLGGWGNSQHAIELAVNGGKSMVGKPVPGKIETGRWYDIRIDYSPERIKCSLDGAVLFDETMPVIRPLHVVAGVQAATGNVILKVVNVGDQAVDMGIDLSASRWKQLEGTAETLTGNDTDENTLEKPNKVAPKLATLKGGSTNFNYKFPARSVTVLKLSEAGRS